MLYSYLAGVTGVFLSGFNVLWWEAGHCPPPRYEGADSRTAFETLAGLALLSALWPISLPVLGLMWLLTQRYAKARASR